MDGEPVISASPRVHQQIENDIYDMTQANNKIEAEAIKYTIKDQGLNSERLGRLTKVTLKRGHNRVLKALNNIGKGKLDDKLIITVDKAKKWISNLLKKK